MSIIGRIFYNFENKVCLNFKTFVGKHEKTVEIMFLIIYFLLQGILAFYISNPIVTLIIIIFLLFLALERIFVHIWLEYEREKLDIIGKESKEQYDELKFNAYREINSLKRDNYLLKEKLKLSKK